MIGAPIGTQSLVHIIHYLQDRSIGYYFAVSVTFSHEMVRVLHQQMAQM